MMNVSKNFINVNMQFIIGENGEFKNFSEIYGRETTDKDRPSSVLKEAATSEQDKQNKPYFKCRYACMDASDNAYSFSINNYISIFFQVCTRSCYISELIFQPGSEHSSFAKSVARGGWYIVQKD